MKKRRRKRRRRRIKPLWILDFLLVLIFLSLVIFAAKTLTDVKKKNQRKASAEIDKEMQAAEENQKAKESKEQNPVPDPVKEEEKSKAAPLPETEKTDASILFGGDFYLDESWYHQYKKEGGISAIASKDILSNFQNATYSCLNLEAIFSDDYPQDTKESVMKSASITALQELGIDGVNLANAGNASFSLEEMKASADFLKENNIEAGGLAKLEQGSDLIKQADIGGNRIGFLYFTDLSLEKDKLAAAGGIISSQEEENLLSAVKKADGINDFIIVYASWGEENNAAITERQSKLAHKLVDAGADLIVGSHTHLLQGVEYYKGKPIVYGLGNFMYKSKHSSAALLKVNLPKEGNVSYSLLPIKSAASTTWVVNSPEEIYQTVSQNSINASIDNSGNIIEGLSQ